MQAEVKLSFLHTYIAYTSNTQSVLLKEWSEAEVKECVATQIA